MSTRNMPTLDTEIIEDEPTNLSISLADLTTLYNQTKALDTADSSKLTSNFTLSGVDGVQDLIAAAMLQIQEFTDHGKAPTTTSKVLARVAPEGSWLGKFVNSKTTAHKLESIKEQSISQVVKTLRDSINGKRDEVITLIETLTSIRSSMLDRLQTYLQIDTKVSALADQAAPNSRAKFDAQQLAIMTKATIEKIHSEIHSSIEPLIASATISVNQIQQLLPTIENDLQTKLTIKTFQQQLQDLNKMVNAASDLATSAGSAIKASVNETIYESLELLSNTGIDVKALKQSAQDEIKHQQKIQQLIAKTSDKINSNFHEITSIQQTLLSSRQTLENNLISQYSESK